MRFQETSESLNIDTLSLPGLLGSIFIKDRTICVLDLSHINSMLGDKIPLTNLRDSEDRSGLEFNNIEDQAA